MSSPHDPDGDRPVDLPVDAEEQAFVRALLGEVGGGPEPLPDDVAARLDARLASLVSERAAGGDGPAQPVVVPLDRARRRRRRGLTALVAAAAVVVGGYTVTTTGLLTGSSGGAADSTAAGGVAAEDGSGSGAAGPMADAGTFPLASRTLRSDARRLVGSGSDELRRLSDTASRLYATRDQAGEDLSEGTGSSKAGAVPLPTRAPAGRCLDPLVPARFTRLAVTYDGAAATAVLRPAGPATSGEDRVRVEVWDCAVPRRLAVVVVPR